MICLKIRTFVVSTTTLPLLPYEFGQLWFAWKFVPLWYQQQLIEVTLSFLICCDLLENSYLCGINNNLRWRSEFTPVVVICLKIRTFVVSTTTVHQLAIYHHQLWFAWKFVPLWYQQQQIIFIRIPAIRLWFAWKFVPLWYQQQPAASNSLPIIGCDLLENSYLCGINNNLTRVKCHDKIVVICLKIRTFVVSTTTILITSLIRSRCDLLENSYLCGINNNRHLTAIQLKFVVICLKIRTFVVSTTTDDISPTPALSCDLLENSYLCGINNNCFGFLFLLLLSCDLLENSYLCGINNNKKNIFHLWFLVVICLKIRTFVVSTTTHKISYS